MSQRNVPEVVNYTAQGRTVKALVLKARDGEVSHLGKNGEPLLTLAIVKQPAPNAPHKRPTPIQIETGTPEVEIVHDVVHASHEFSAEFKEKKGVKTVAEIASHRGHGEWSEVEAAPVETPITAEALGLKDEPGPTDDGPDAV
jgi:hypothetical protein